MYSQVRRRPCAPAICSCTLQVPPRRCNNNCISGLSQNFWLQSRVIVWRQNTLRFKHFCTQALRTPGELHALHASSASACEVLTVTRTPPPPKKSHNAAHHRIGMECKGRMCRGAPNICRSASLGDASPITHLLPLLSSGVYNIYGPSKTVEVYAE